MAEKKTAAEPKAMAPELKRKLAWRMTVAGAMIVVLLGALAVFDRINTPDEEDESPRFTAPVPTVKNEVSQPVTSTPLPEAPEKAQEKPAEPEASAAPSTPSAAPGAGAEKPARPEVAAQPALPRSAGAARSAPAAGESRSAAAPTAGSPAAAARPAAPPAASTAAANSAPPVAASTAATALPPAAPTRLLNGFALQTGVFADVRRAEEMHALLTLNGIPSTLEARVQAGPFATRAEANAARDKLKSLGIDSVLLAPKKAGRP